jgi:hypothetical protein
LRENKGFYHAPRQRDGSWSVRRARQPPAEECGDAVERRAEW